MLFVYAHSLLYVIICGTLSLSLFCYWLMYHIHCHIYLSSQIKEYDANKRRS
jgi:hypothetical protein